MKWNLIDISLGENKKIHFVASSTHTFLIPTTAISSNFSEA